MHASMSTCEVSMQRASDGCVFIESRKRPRDELELEDLQIQNMRMSK